MSGLVLTACAPTQWVKPGASQQDYSTDSYACEKDARQSSYFGGGIIGEINFEDFESKCMVAHGWRVAGTAAAQPDPKIAELKEAVQERKSCVRAVRQEPVFAALEQHFSDPETGRFSIAQLADERVPTSAEAAVLVRYVDESSLCTDKFAATATRFAPPVGAVLAEQKNQLQQVMLQIVKRQIGWGDASQKQQEITNATVAKLREIHL